MGLCDKIPFDMVCVRACVCVCVQKLFYTHYLFLNVIIFIRLLNEWMNEWMNGLRFTTVYNSNTNRHESIRQCQPLKAFETLNSEYTGFKSVSRYWSSIILFNPTDITSRSNESPGEPAHLCSPIRAPRSKNTYHFEEQRMPGQACASAQSHQGIRCSFAHALEECLGLPAHLPERPLLVRSCG